MATTVNNDSILVTVKKMLGMASDYTAFDMDITIHINTVLASLVQMGIGPVTGFAISGIDQKWSDFVGSETLLIQQVKTYVYAKVKLIFDPPSNGNMLEALKSAAAEAEWRIHLECNKEEPVEPVVPEEE